MNKTLSAALCAMLFSSAVLAQTPNPDATNPPVQPTTGAPTATTGAASTTGSLVAPAAAASTITVTSVAIGAGLLVGAAALGAGGGSSGTSGTSGTN